MSSYGAIVNYGVADPFGYTRDGPTRPPSMDDMSMSMSVDDTFSFIHHNRGRKGVDSDASSFYFQAPQSMYPYRRLVLDRMHSGCILTGVSNASSDHRTRHSLNIS